MLQLWHVHCTAKNLGIIKLPSKILHKFHIDFHVYFCRTFDVNFYIRVHVYSTPHDSSARNTTLIIVFAPWSHSQHTVCHSNMTWPTLRVMVSRSTASGIVFEGSQAFQNVTCFKTRDVRSYAMSGQHFSELVCFYLDQVKSQSFTRRIKMV